MISAILIGNLANDHNVIDNREYLGPGGSVYFAAKTFENLKVQPFLISPRGSDFPGKYLKNTVIYPVKPKSEKTLVFRNIYDPKKERVQWVENYQNAALCDIKKILLNIPEKQNILFVAPILNNIDISALKLICKYFPKSLKVLLPQGFFRKIGRYGKIISRFWQNSERIISLFDIIVISEKDWNGAEDLAKGWGKITKISIVTKEERGCSIYMGGIKKDYPGFKITDIIDATGAGDVFAAAFSVAYLKNHDVDSSARFANAAAALSLRFTSNQLKYNYSDIIKLLRKEERR